MGRRSPGTKQQPDTYQRQRVGVQTRSQRAAACRPCSWTQLPEPCRYTLVRCMDVFTRGAFRQVSHQACQDVYDATHRLLTAPNLRILALLDSADFQALNQNQRRDQSPPALPTAVFHKCPRLQRIECTDTPQLRSLKGLPPRLQVLKLRGCHNIRRWDPLLQCSELRRLTLEGPVSRGLKPPAGLLSTLYRLTTLHKLSLKANGWQESDEVLQLEPVVGCLTQLRKLTIAYAMPWGGGISCCPTFTQLSSLTHLDLRGSLFGAQGAEALATVVTAFTNLEHLNLDGDNFSGVGQDGVSVLAPVLGTLASLRQLRMCRDLLHPDGAAALAPAVSQLTGLRQLRLSNNGLGPEGVAALAPAVRHHPSLAVLDLSHNDLGDQGVVELAGVLGTMTALRLLDLRSNGAVSRRVKTQVKAAAAAVPGLKVLIKSWMRRSWTIESAV